MLQDSVLHSASRPLNIIANSLGIIIMLDEDDRSHDAIRWWILITSFISTNSPEAPGAPWLILAPVMMFEINLYLACPWLSGPDHGTIWSNQDWPIKCPVSLTTKENNKEGETDFGQKLVFQFYVDTRI